MNGIPVDFSIPLPAGWTVERHHHAKHHENREHDALTTYTLHSPDGKSAVFYNVDGEADLLLDLLRAISAQSTGPSK